MRRSICYAEPQMILAGETGTWKFVYTTSVSLPKGTLFRFDLGSKGRNIDWEAPEVNLKKNSNVIYAINHNGKVLQAEAIEVPHSFIPQYQFTLPQEMPANGQLVVCVGAPKGQDEKKYGNRAQLTIQRRRPFVLYVDPSGKSNFHQHEVFSIDIKGNTLYTIKILAPSFAVKNRRFDLVLRFEDEYGNLTNNAPEKTLIELSHENLRENLKWNLFIPETGFITLPNLYFNDPGVYTIKLRNVQTNELYFSSPIKCFAQDTKQLFWGLLHGESERFDSTESIESCLRHFRDEKSLNFYGTSSFESQEETSNDMWKLISQNAEDFNEAERFVTLLGFQWVGESSEEGIRNMVYLKDQKQILRKKDPKNTSLKKIYKSNNPKEFISIPCLTMASKHGFNFQDFNEEFERVVEIYNAWGSSECTKAEGNLKPIQGESKKSLHESKEGSIVNALLQGKRFGFVAGGLDDRGVYADLYDGDQVQYSPGLTAILSDELSKASLFEALYNRNCYATTGERIILGFSIVGLSMGSEVDTVKKPGLHVNRYINGHVAGAKKIKKIDLIRNGKVMKSFTPNANSFEFELDDMTPLKDVVVEAKDRKTPFVFYYLRVLMEDDNMAWSSPIWIDYIPGTIKVSSKKPSDKSDKKKEPTNTKGKTK